MAQLIFFCTYASLQLFLFYATVIAYFRFLLKVIADADILIVAFAKFGIELF